MKQLIHNCPDCGHRSESDRAKGLCPDCFSHLLKNEINPNAPAVNDSLGGRAFEVGDV